MSMWVFRIGLERDGGAPRNQPPEAIRREVVVPDLRHVRQTLLRDLPGKADFLSCELFKHGRLRQGWGMPGLDLRRPQATRTGKPARWIEEFIRGAWEYWDEQVDVEGSYGRWCILMPMEDGMQADDAVFIPNCGPSGFDEDIFTMATVDRSEQSDWSNRPYYFEDRAGRPDTWEKDFGHVIPVRDVQSFHRAATGLSFAAPYLYAVSKIALGHQRYGDFRAFIHGHGVDR